MTVEVELLNSRRLRWCLYFDPTVGINLVPGDLMAEGGQVIRSKMWPLVEQITHSITTSLYNVATHH